MNLEDIKGVGSSTIKALNSLNIHSIEDLVTFYPFRYEIYKEADLDKVNDGDKIVLSGILENNASIYYISSKLNKISFRMISHNHLIKVSIFNRAFMKSALKIGTKVNVIGKYSKKNDSITATNIRLGFLEKEEIIPIYHSNSNITNKKIRSLIKNALEIYKPIDYIPEEFNKKYKLMDKLEALKIIHNPNNHLKRAIAKLKYEELFIFMLKINYLKQGNTKNNGLSRDVDYKYVQKLIDSLPFKLTVDQEKCVKIIYQDLTSKKRMNRLVQGDVGSGKTIVSFIALFINFLGKYQGALMAPTEILALQHYQKLKELLPSTNISLLTGKVKGRERKKILDNLANGTCDIVVGTHALISENVKYKNLGLVITDEQHRFGVNQRDNLKNKGITPDILYMSATPIPRTYALTLYGDMDVSSIHSMPSGRKPVKTIIKKNSEIKDVLYMMLDELKKHHQIYVIAPLVDNDESEMESVTKLKKNLDRAFIKFKKINIGILHGKMKPKEKEEIMQKFKDQKINILVSTTVIEVGVDVENATMMVIFDSYRFGLSTLHQLRGRVGRNSLDSYCILVTDRDSKRLDILTKTNDGFKISEEDFKLRGSGDLFGLRQSGDMNFKLANLKEDYNIVLRAKEDSSIFLEKLDINNSIYHDILLNSKDQS